MPAAHLYPVGSIQSLIESDLVTPPTRRALKRRLHCQPAAPRFFTEAQFTTLEAICGRLLPQPERDSPIDLAGALDALLADGIGDGWRYAAMPPDGEAQTLGLQGIDEAAVALSGMRFHALPEDLQHDVLRLVQAGSAPGAAWQVMPAALYFEELLAALVELYYAHPLAAEEIGYAGMADARGWRTVGLGAREAHEPSEARTV